MLCFIKTSIFLIIISIIGSMTGFGSYILHQTFNHTVQSGEQDNVWIWSLIAIIIHSITLIYIAIIVVLDENCLTKASYKLGYIWSTLIVFNSLMLLWGMFNCYG